MKIEEIVTAITGIITGAGFTTELTALFGGTLTVPTITAATVKAYDFDLDKNRRDLMVFILPDGDALEGITLDGTHEVRSQISMFFIYRNDTREDSFKKVLRTVSCFMEILKGDPTMTGTVSDSSVQAVEYYHAVEGSEDVKGAELTLEAIYET